jgi:hypothetical protein
MVLLIPQDMPRCRRAPRIRRECTRHPDGWSVSLRETGVEGAQPEQRSVESRVVLALKPDRLFRLLAWRRPLPKALEKRWLVAAYRVSAVAILLWVIGQLIEFGRS